MDTEAILKTWSRKKISCQDLKGLFQIESDSDLYDLVTDAVANGLLSPVKADGTNGNQKYPVYLKYRLSVVTDYNEALSEIRMLHPSILKSGYLQNHPDKYLKHKTALQKLSGYLFHGISTVPVSKKERSFEIFDEEKQLEDSSLRILLDKLGITAEVLKYYDTPEYCFNDFISERKEHMTLLICENKDIWFNVRRRMYEDGVRILFGIPIDGVVYGCGNRISGAGALEAYTGFLRASKVSYLYWGDIDRAGLDIYLSLRKSNPEINVRLFTEAYCEMIRLSEGRTIPDSADLRERSGDYGEIIGFFPEELRDRLRWLLTENKRVPQEIVSYDRLLRYMR